MPRLRICHGCRRRPTSSPDGRCSTCKLPPRPRGRHHAEVTRPAVFAAGGGICHICRQPIATGQAWHVDHVHPRSLGGADRITNYAPAHDGCNLRKGAKT